MANDSAAQNDRAYETRVPPQALDVEVAVLGAMMLDPDAVGHVIEVLDAEDFYKPAHGKIYAAMLALFDRNEPVDMATVASELEKSGELQKCGGPNGLIDIADSVFTAANATALARIIKDKAVLRQLITEASRIAQECHTAPGDVGELLDDTEGRIFAISEKRWRQDFVSLAEILPKTFESIEEYNRRGGGITGLPTGFDELDQLTAGLHPSDLVILAGRPSMGKTALALNIMENLAIDHHKPCAIFSLEMSKEQLAQRMLCSRAKINAHSMRTGRLRASEYSALSIAVGPLSEAPVFIDDSAAIGILELRAKARRLKAQHNIQLIVLDYMQMMHGPRNVENRQQEIAMISRSLKSLAKELELPVLALSQLSRQVEQRGGERRPQLSDLRESGAIEQDADVVMFVYRAERYDITTDKAGNPLHNVAEVIVGKQRNGPTGTARLAFLKDYARFENLSRDVGIGVGQAEGPGPYPDDYPSGGADDTPF
ncbi:MAG: replicative DNA helicase [candidate division Zixibacteria bacterium]|nr:replicative DNA helicase [candidate division Zixibacteria bacterium]